VNTEVGEEWAKRLASGVGEQRGEKHGFATHTMMTRCLACGAVSEARTSL